MKNITSHNATIKQCILPNSYSVDIKSCEIGQTYRLFVGGHDRTSIDDQTHDIIFVVDGNWVFPLIAEYIRTVTLFEPLGHLPVVVGIGYPTNNDNTILGLRNRDMSLLSPSLSRVDAFSDFVTETVSTFVESDLGIKTKRKFLAGHSWGGAFALYNMTKHAPAYDGYLASSPWIVGTDLEQKLVEMNNVPEDTKLFYSMGALEHMKFPAIGQSIPILDKLRNVDESKNHNTKRVIFDDEDHSSAVSLAISKGTRFLLRY